MALVPGAIIFVNNDLVDQTKNRLIQQLHINQVYDGYVYDDIIALNPDFPLQTRLANQRVLVIRPFTELDNRATADVVIFVKHALASILKNNFGPPGQTHSIFKLHWSQLNIFKTNLDGYV